MQAVALWLRPFIDLYRRSKDIHRRDQYEAACLDRFQDVEQDLDSPPIIIGVLVGPPFDRLDARTPDFVEIAALERSNILGINAGVKGTLAIDITAHETGIADQRSH